VLEREPKHTQALLTQVSILQVQGRYAEAKGVFRSHPQLTGSLLGVSALASVSSLSGQLEQGTALLERFLQQRGAAANEAAWAWTTLAEMYARGGRNDDAERALRAAWEADRSDIYLLTAYADFLNAQQRASEVLRMIPVETENDGLVLRRIIALRQAGEASAALAEERLRAKFSTFDPGDHLRERALFELAVAGLTLGAGKLEDAAGADRYAPRAASGAGRETSGGSGGDSGVDARESDQGPNAGAVDRAVGDGERFDTLTPCVVASLSL
jgi:tetratricopeptide (TPR) repeat protein